MSKARTEAFSDGVFAIAITLLILEIKVPHASGLSNWELAQELLALWPSFLAFVGSFATILVMWINHHGLFTLVDHAHPRFLFANGFLLLLITFIPFPTAILARHLTGPGANMAAVVYCGTYVAISVAYLLLLTSATSVAAIRPGVQPSVVRRIRIAYTCGFVFYVTSTVVAWFHALTGVVICTLLWVLWVNLRYTDAESRSEIGRSQ